MPQPGSSALIERNLLVSRTKPEREAVGIIVSGEPFRHDDTYRSGFTAFPVSGRLSRGARKDRSRTLCRAGPVHPLFRVVFRG